MGYVPGLDIDVFISYAHKNNAAGWVDGLRQYLKTHVPEFLPHSADVEIWQDQKLNGFDEVWESLRDRVNSSALLLSIFSPVYATSDSCEKEVVGFLTESRETPRVERTSRTARAVIIPYEADPSIKATFRRESTVRYTFFKENGGVIEQHEVGSPEFKTEANRLTQHIATQLRKMRAEAERVSPPQGQAAQRKLFVANSASDRATERKTLINEFKGFELLTLPSDVLTRADIEQQTRRLLDQAECSIHLLGELPGTTPEDSSDPIAHLQYQVALAHRPDRFTQLVWAPSTLALADARQKAFVESVRKYNSGEWPKGLEILCGGLDDLLRGVRGVLDRVPAAPRFEGTGPVYLLCNESDIKNADPNLDQLRDFLLRAGISPEFPAFDDEDVDLAQLEKTQIAQSCATIIYYGRGGDGWAKLKRNQLLATLGELRAQNTHVRALYVSEPPSAWKNRQYVEAKVREFGEARGFPPLLVLGEAGGFDGRYLQPLLDRLNNGGGH
jgi:hypothetical protein